MKKFHLLIIVLTVICISAPPLIKKLEADFIYNERVFFVEEKIALKNLPRDINNLHIWLPYPVNDEWQMINDFKLTGPFDADFVIDREYGNKTIYLRPEQNFLSGDSTEIKLFFKVQRKECNAASGSSSYKDLSQFLKPNSFVPVNGRIKMLAEKITQSKESDMERIRAIYDYIIDELTYSKDDPNVCGIGNSLITLEVKKGICTDYHSLFISLVRSLGIPAKFEIGFPVPRGVKEHTRNGYHCWAKFYLKDRGWIPVDISEADKHPEKKDYFFGHIDENRTHFTTGRDIRLAYAKNPEPLNFFIYPYAELNGSEFNNIDFEITFRDFEGGDGKN